ncbi:MAG: response regulator transcription factor [Bacteroidales bacterium]|nr:response regulator transcription factor [Bacteroidales bacterium]
MIKLIIADDHQLVVDGLQSILNQLSGFKVITTVSNGKELLKTLEIVEPDIVLLDIDMPVLNGIETLKELKKRYPHIKIIILTMHEEKSLVKKMSDLGANGFIFKNVDKEELIKALENVNNGIPYFSVSLRNESINNDLVADAGLSHDYKKGLLTEREIEIIKLIVEGLSNKEIADKLFISPRTVDTHRTNLMKKLEVNNVAGLVRYAIRNGFMH